jgi:hypothetical protein
VRGFGCGILDGRQYTPCTSFDAITSATVSPARSTHSTQAGDLIDDDVDVRTQDVIRICDLDEF